MNDLHVAVRDGSIGRTVALLARGSSDIDQPTSDDGLTPLILAALTGHSSIARILLNKGADLSIASNAGFTALHLAAQFGHLEVMTALVEAGADLQATAADGSTPLHLAAKYGHLEAMMALVEAGADLQATAADGFTPLHLAAQGGHLEVMTALVEAGADIQAPISDDGRTPLHLAAQFGHLEVMTALVEAGADLQATAADGSTPLHLAAKYGHLEAMMALVEAGADLQATAAVGCTPLHLAAQNGHLEVMTALVKAGADLQATTAIGSTPLHLAAQNGHLRVMKALFSVQAFDVDSRDKFGHTPLLFAIIFGCCSPRAVRFLIDAGADTTSAVQITWDDGKVLFDDTPLDATNWCLREKKVGGNEATEEQLHGLEGIRRLLLRVDAAHAASWLWHEEGPIIGRASEGSRRGKVGSTPLSRMLPVLRRRARSRGVLLRALFRYSSKSAGDDLETGASKGS